MKAIEEQKIILMIEYRMNMMIRSVNPIIDIKFDRVLKIKQSAFIFNHFFLLSITLLNHLFFQASSALPA